MDYKKKEKTVTELANEYQALLERTALAKLRNASLMAQIEYERVCSLGRSVIEKCLK